MSTTVNGRAIVTEAYARAAFRKEIDLVREAPEGTRNDTLNTAAFNLHRFIAIGLLDRNEVEEELADAAQDAGLAPKEIRDTIRSGFKGGNRVPVTITAVMAASRADGTDRARRLAALDAWLVEIGQAPPSDFAKTILKRSELKNLPKVEPLIHGVISRRSVALMVGPTGIGKTFCTLSMSLSIATGTSWIGHEVERTRVLYVVGEGGSGLDSRVEAWESAWGVPVEDTDMYFSIQPRSLHDGQTWVEIRDEAIRLGVGLVVLDTFSSLAPDADETKDAATMTRRLADLARVIDGTVLLVHHPGWSDATRSRGGYQFEANVDEVLVLSGVTDSDLLELKRKKVKEGVDGDRFWLRRRPWGGSCIIESANAQDAEVPLRTRVLALLGEVGDEGITAPQLAKALGLPDGNKGHYPVLRKLEEQGLVRKDGVRGFMRYFLVPVAP